MKPFANQQISAYLSATFPDLLAAYVFGSQVSGQTHADSDVDLAILCPKKMDNYQLWEKAQQLASTLNLDVDIVNIFEASPLLQYKIITTGKRILTRDIEFVEFFENKAILKYLEWQQRIQPLYDDFVQSRKKKNG